MSLRTFGVCLLPAVCLAGLGLWSAAPVHGASDPRTLPASTTWNRLTAANYLDSREVWWQKWPTAQMDHGTVCISCHTVVPYAIARSALRQDLEESGTPAPERVLIENVEMRVSHWSEMIPFYSDEKEGPGKTAQSHATEAVMNAVILAGYDKRAGHLRPITQTALNAVWALQEQAGENAGGWIWQDFHLAPWESAESAYQGAAMLMLEVGTAPDVFARDAGNRAHLALLRQYLQKHYAAQPLLNQIYVYWAAANVPGLLTGAQQKDLLQAVVALQQTDGGWRLASLEEKERLDKTPQSKESDGFATALVLLSMEAAPARQEGQSLQRGLAWLEQHQEKDGRWRATSLNKERDPLSNIGLFMSDAATGYAVLALEEAKARTSHSSAPGELSSLAQR